MKDTLLTAAVKRRELITAALCFAAAMLVNAGAILHYGSRWRELYTQIGFVLVLAGLFYAAVWVVRLIAAAFRKKR